MDGGLQVNSRYDFQIPSLQKFSGTSASKGSGQGRSNTASLRPLKFPNGSTTDLSANFSRMLSSLAEGVESAARRVDEQQRLSSVGSFHLEALAAEGYQLENTPTADYRLSKTLPTCRGASCRKVLVFDRRDNQLVKSTLEQDGRVIYELRFRPLDGDRVAVSSYTFLGEGQGYAKVNFPADGAILDPQPDLVPPPCEDPPFCDDGGGGGGGGGGGTGNAPDVAFIHGLNGNASSWSTGRAYIDGQFNINGSLIGYASSGSISGIASTVAGQIQAADYVVAHSMGGLVTREAIRQGIDGNLEGLITVGTPHLGAPFANNPSAFPALLLDWTFDIVNPLAFTLDYVNGIDLSWVNQVQQVVGVVASYAQPIVDPFITGSAPAVS